MGFATAIGTGFRKYFVLSGRASRSEYWWWTLFLFLGSVLYTSAAHFALAGRVEAELDTMTLAGIGTILVLGGGFSLVTLVPTMTLTVRRLHDIGRTGGWVLLPWLLNAVIVWGVLKMAPQELVQLGLARNAADTFIGGIVTLGASLAMLVLSILMLIWMAMPGTKGDNFFGPDPRGPARRDEGFARSPVPQVPRTAGAPVAAPMSRQDEIHALYQSRVLGRRP